MCRAGRGRGASRSRMMVSTLGNIAARADDDEESTCSGTRSGTLN